MSRSWCSGSVLDGDDGLPGEQLLQHAVATVLDRRVEVHDLVGDPDVVHLPLDLRVAAGAVGGGGRLGVHVLPSVLLLALALQHTGPGADAGLQPAGQLLLHRLVELGDPGVQVAVGVQAQVVHGLLDLV